jgi:hypothetical protein
MSRLGALFRSRIAVALLGMTLVGGGGAYWAVTSGATLTPRASSAQTNQDSTSTAHVEDPTGTATTDPGATATTIRSTPTPRPTATLCLTPTSAPVGQSVHWQGRVVSVSVGDMSFVLRVGCGRPTIVVDSRTQWTGSVKSLAALRTGANAEILATRQSDGAYLASSVNAQNDN